MSPALATPESGSGSADSRIIRVFLSSTFRDFMAERDRLVKVVFPELRRKARERGVEVVEVDLRWGITEEESRQGKVLPICLAEINRCRPYFVGMLGERYGWVPPDDDDNRVVLAEEEYAWVEEHLGRRSVTELEVLHGVLNNPEMAGRAFFYFRDPAWSLAQTEPGFVCDNDEEKEKLADLKQRIRVSRFPVVEDLPDPEALADRIGADLWALIEEQFPELDQPDALEREERKHASYRRARTELYEDGGKACVKVSQLEQWIAAGEQRILITGESGAGKSALIANWMQRHQNQYPGDVFHAHHLGCSNDANALEPMLARMVQAASKLMAEDSDQTLSEPIKIPQDYWELVSTVTDTLSKLSFWCKQQGRRWIWVLDGLDRLPEENQQALPWLPLQLFPHLHVVISALDCPARTILQEREYTTLTIGPLERDEQKALIATYMRRFNKTLVPELEARILDHQPRQGPPPASSPLFLRVVLDELRVCGRHETLAQQLDDYLTADSVDALYAKVLERLELDMGREPVQKVMTALWASRAGLSETELLAITKVKPLQWAPIDLGLEGSLGRNGERLVFDHDYLRQAVKARYLFSSEAQRQAHSELADWFGKRDGWDERVAEEYPWQLQLAARSDQLRDLILTPWLLAQLNSDRGSSEVINYWLVARGNDDDELDELIADDLEQEIDKRSVDTDDLIWFVYQIASLYDSAGLYREPLLKLRSLSLELENAGKSRSEESMLSSLTRLAEVHRDMGSYDTALQMYLQKLEAIEQLLGLEHPSTLTYIGNLALLYQDKGDYEQAEVYYLRCLEAEERILGREHPSTLDTIANFAECYRAKGDFEKAEALFNCALEASERLLGLQHPKTILTVGNLAGLYRAKGDYGKAEKFYSRCLAVQERLLGGGHPKTLTTISNLAVLYQDRGDYEKAKDFFTRALEARECLLGREHPDTLITIGNLALFYKEMGDYEQAQAFYNRCLEAEERLLGHEHPSTLTTVGNLAGLYQDQGDYEQAQAFYNRCLEAEERLLGHEHPSTLTTVGNLAGLYQDQGDYEQAQAFYNRCLEAEERLLGHEHPSTLTTVGNLAGLYQDQGDYDKAEAFYQRCLEARERLLGREHPDTLITIGNLALFYKETGDYEQAQAFYNRCLEAEERLLGHEHPSTLTTVDSLGGLYQDMGNVEMAEVFFNRCLRSRDQMLGSEHADTLCSLYSLAELLSTEGRCDEAIPLWRRLLASLRQQQGDIDPMTLTCVNHLAVDLRETGALEEAEMLFRELVTGRQQVLEPGDFGIGRALGGLAKTLEQAGKLEEALSYAQRALEHCLKHEGPEAWWTNRKRLDLGRLLVMAGKHPEAHAILTTLSESMALIEDPDDQDLMLIDEASALLQSLQY